MKPLRLVFLLPLLAVACSKAPEEPSSALTSSEGVLRYVPADTPYVFAALESPPKEVSDKLGAASMKVMRAYGKMVRGIINQPPAEGAAAALDDETRERVSAMIDELTGMVTPEGIPEAGIDRSSTVAIYGVGLLPVVRVTLSDGALFEATFATLEADAGKPMSVASIDGHSYRYAGNDKGRVIVAVIDDQLVLSVAPTALGEDLLKRVLGLTLPEMSIADSGELATLAGTYGYTAYGLGLVDVGRIAGTFLDEQSGVNDALLKLMEHDRTTLSDVCRDEIRAVAGVVPRVVAGYTEMSTERITSKSVIELRGDLATGLQQITAPVPGLGQEHGGLLSLGMSIDLPALREFYSARLDALEADPFECELFADAQSGVAAGRAALQKPLPPAVYSFHGFLAVIDDIKGMDIAKKQPPTDIDMRFLLASSNAQGLVAMGAMFSPQIAELDLKPDSKPVKLDLPAGAAPISEAWVAMSEDALAVSVGAGGAAALTELMTSSAAEPSPFMSMDVDAGRYYGFLGDTLATAEPAGADEKAAPREVIEATEELMTSFRDVFDRISFDIQFTERGVEIPSTMALADNDT